jgi:glycosyltransferase involved in cell wall biosynthesis
MPWNGNIHLWKESFRIVMIKISYPLVSICIPSYNSSNYILKTLDSIGAQSYPNLELLILDDFSTDNTRDVIYEWVLRNSKIRVSFICSLSNRGIVETCAELFELINGEYFQILGSDDLLHHDKITKQVKVFRDLGEDYALLFGDVIIINNVDDILHDSYFVEQKITVENIFDHGISLSLINQFIKTSISSLQF